MAEPIYVLETKRCSRCGLTKFLKDFYPPDGKTGKVRGTCKECKRRQSSESQKRRATKVREYQRAYRAGNKERIAYLQKERQKRHAERNPESAAEKHKRWRSNHPDRKLLYSARARAKSKGIEFSLTPEWLESRLSSGVCELAGIPISFDEKSEGRCRAFSPSIDRIDSSLGYTPDNCRVVCWAINMAMSEWGEETFAVVAKKYLENQRA